MNAKPVPSRQSLEELERARRLHETEQVLAQPHRRGDDSDMTDALGTFVRRENCGRRCYEAGQLYIQLVAKWRRAKGIPQRVRIEEEGVHGGGELDKGVVKGWGERIAECENAMKCSGLPGFRAAQELVLEDFPPPVRLYGPVKRAITQLAICLGLFQA
jgi:hypothetical protein